MIDKLYAVINWTRKLRSRENVINTTRFFAELIIIDSAPDKNCVSMYVEQIMKLLNGNQND